MDIKPDVFYLVPEKEDHYVFDIRNGRVQGPFFPSAAYKYAADLNEMIRKNAGLKPKFKVRGPRLDVDPKLSLRR